MFNPAKVDGLIFYLRTRTEVRFAHRDFVRVLGADPPPDVERPLSTAIPLSTGLPVPHDGFLQARSGDVITVTYVQPDGAILAQSATLPDMSP